MRYALLMTMSLLLAGGSAARAADNAANPIRPRNWRWMQMRLHGLVHTHTPQLNFTILDFPRSTSTYLFVPNPGAIPHAKTLGVGAYIPGAGGTGAANGMLLTLSSKNARSVESYETIAPSLTNPSPNAVNDHGVIVGTVYGLNAPPIDGFLLDKGAITHITYPAGELDHR
jgi:hypothetical protein